MGNREKRFLPSLEKHDTQLAIRLEDVWAEFMALKNALQRAIESGHKRQAQQLVLQIRALMAGQPQGRRESTGLPLELRERFAQPRFKPSVRELLNMIEMQAWILRNSDLGAGSRSGGLLKRDTGAPKALRINIAPPAVQGLRRHRRQGDAARRCHRPRPRSVRARRSHLFQIFRVLRIFRIVRIVRIVRVLRVLRVLRIG